MRLAEVTALLDGWYDPAWAEPWDRVGLVAGDPAQEVRRVLFAVDPVEAVVEDAVALRADLVVVHHPLLLTPVSSVAATTAKVHVRPTPPGGPEQGGLGWSVGTVMATCYASMFHCKF